MCYNAVNTDMVLTASGTQSVCIAHSKQWLCLLSLMKENYVWLIKVPKTNSLARM